MLQNEKILRNEIAKFGESEAYPLMIQLVEKNLFEKFKILLDKEGADELFYVLKGLREVENAIQMCINENTKTLEENI